MTWSAADRIFCFGRFEANEAAAELRKDGIRVKLNSQPFRVLLMLLERPSSVVTREEMRLELWGEDTFVDFDHGLNTAINKVREALNDSPSQPRYIETVSGKGYRFIAPVTQRTPLSQTSEKSVDVAAAAEEIARAPLISTSSEDVQTTSEGRVLASPHELPFAPRTLVKSLLLLVQTMYLAFYFGALANIPEIHDIFSEARLPFPPSALMTVLVITAAVSIPIRLFLLAAVAFDLRQLPVKFRKVFPILLPLDLLWSLSPFLLVHHVSTGLALAMSVTLVYMPFAQRSLVLMYARER